jgi:hypothetical protein
MKYCIVQDKEFPKNPGGYAFMFAKNGCCCRDLEAYIREDQECPPDTYTKKEAEKNVEKWNRYATEMSIKYKIVPYEDVAVFLAEVKLRFI